MDKIDTIEKIGTKLKYDVKARDQIRNLSKHLFYAT